jgi:hypothetical protein
MKFRRIYWVTEQVDADGSSKVAGVYTSIPDLLDGGLAYKDDLGMKVGFRLTLVKLDSLKTPLGCWSTPDFGSIARDLGEYIESGEFKQEDCDELLAGLRQISLQA